ncbi:hypothetical protein QBC44DRAFT_356684 [Cladorrhinum sp. PSN332]|nr:hypothetical protein QBC44DRAFT_356684 [Cladorrhinum sp. PSN332]
MSADVPALDEIARAARRSAKYLGDTHRDFPGIRQQRTADRYDRFSTAITSAYHVIKDHCDRDPDSESVRCMVEEEFFSHLREDSTIVRRHLTALNKAFKTFDQHRAGSRASQNALASAKESLKALEGPMESFKLKLQLGKKLVEIRQTETARQLRHAMVRTNTANSMGQPRSTHISRRGSNANRELRSFFRPMMAKILRLYSHEERLGFMSHNADESNWEMEEDQTTLVGSPSVYDLDHIVDNSSPQRFLGYELPGSIPTSRPIP